MSFKHSIFLNNEDFIIEINGFFPLEIEIDPNEVLNNEVKVHKIKYFLNEKLFHTEMIDVDDFENGDPRNKKIIKKFLYDPNNLLPLNNVIRIEVYTMTVSLVIQYWIYVNLSYPSMANLEENLFFDTIKLIHAKVEDKNNMLYIFEAKKTKIDALTEAIENEYVLLPVMVEWLEKINDFQENLEDVLYDKNPYEIKEPFALQTFDEINYQKNEPLEENLLHNQKYTIQNNNINKETIFNGVKTVSLQKINLPNALNLNNSDFSFKIEGLFTEKDHQSNFKGNFYTQKNINWQEINDLDEILIYIPNSLKIKQKKQNIFNCKKFENDMGILRECSSNTIFRIKKINKNYYLDNLSEFEKNYLDDIYLLIKFIDVYKEV